MEHLALSTLDGCVFFFFAISALHCGAVQTYEDVSHQTGNKAVTDEEGGTWKDPVLPEFKVLSKHLIERKHSIPQSYYVTFGPRFLSEKSGIRCFSQSLVMDLSNKDFYYFPLILQKGIWMGS